MTIGFAPYEAIRHIPDTHFGLITYALGGRGGVGIGSREDDEFGFRRHDPTRVRAVDPRSTFQPASGGPRDRFGGNDHHLEIRP